MPLKLHMITFKYLICNLFTYQYDILKGAELKAKDEAKDEDFKTKHYWLL